jgi:hypothetical protein
MNKQIDIYQREVGKTKRYMFIPEDLITEEQAKGICNIINNGGNIDVACSFTKFSNNYEFNWKVKESLVRAEAAVFNQFVPYLKGNMNAATSAAATQAPAAAPQQQGPRTFILPITGTIIKEFKDAPSKFYFDLPFYDQSGYDELYDDFILGTALIHWGSNINADNTIANFSFKIAENATNSQTEEDLATLDKLIQDYLAKYLAQKNAPAAAQPAVANLDGIKLGEPYFLLPATQVQVYKEDNFNIPTYYFFLMGQNNMVNMSNVLVERIASLNYVPNESVIGLRVKVSPDLIKVKFEINTGNISQQEYTFLDIDDKLMELGYIKPKTTGNGSQANGPKA